MSNRQNSESVSHSGDIDAVDTLVEVVKKLRHELALCREAMDMKGGFDPAYSSDARDAILEADAVVNALRSNG